MPVMPRDGHMARRAEVAADKKDKDEAMTQQQRMMRQQQMMYQRQQQMQQQQQQAAHRPMTYEEKKELRKKELLTETELSEGMEDGSKQGRVFRFFFIGMVGCLLLFLAFLKVDSEVGIELPEHVKRLSYSAQGVGADGKTATEENVVRPGSVTDLPEKEQQVLDSYLEELNLKKPQEKPQEASTPDSDTDSDAPETPEQRIKRRRREDHEFKSKLKEAHTNKLGEQNALTVCGRACQEKYTGMQLQYDQINQQVTNELWSVVSETEDDAESARENPSFVNPHKLKRTVDAKIKKIEEEVVEEGTEAHLDQQLAIAEIKDTYAILANEESRRYYALTGKKPPPAMSKMSQRDGGWGQNLLLRTHYHKLILTWLQFLENSKIDSFTILFVFICLFLGPALAKLPQTVAMAQRMADEWEAAAEQQKTGKNQ